MDWPAVEGDRTQQPYHSSSSAREKRLWRWIVSRRAMNSTATTPSSSSHCRRVGTYPGRLWRGILLVEWKRNRAVEGPPARRSTAGGLVAESDRSQRLTDSLKIIRLIVAENAPVGRCPGLAPLPPARMVESTSVLMTESVQRRGPHKMHWSVFFFFWPVAESRKSFHSIASAG
jgi:hypothetical protein